MKASIMPDRAAAANGPSLKGTRANLFARVPFRAPPGQKQDSPCATTAPIALILMHIQQE